MNIITKSLNPTYIVTLQKLVQALSGLGTALMVTHFLSPVEQGYYYTFGSLLSSYIIFDLGLSSYILQKSAQLSSTITIDANGKIHPQGENRNHFIAFVKWSILWYRNAGVATLFILAPVGLLILENNNSQLNFNQSIAWFLVITAISISMPTIGFFAILEGTGKITETYTLRICHYCVGTSLAWLLIATGNSLFALAMPFIATILISYIYFNHKFKNSISTGTTTSDYLYTSNALQNIKYSASISLSNYIFLNAPVLIAYTFGNIEIAGQLGLAIIIANVGGAMAMSSTTSLLPQIIKLVTKNYRRDAYLVFIKCNTEFAFLFTFGTALLLIIRYTFNDNSFVQRLPDVYNLTYIFLYIGLYHALNTCISYLRAMQINKPALFSASTLFICPLGNVLGNYFTIQSGILMCLSIIPLLLICIYLVRKNKY